MTVLILIRRLSDDEYVIKWPTPLPPDWLHRHYSADDLGELWEYDLRRDMARFFSIARRLPRDMQAHMASITNRVLDS